MELRVGKQYSMGKRIGKGSFGDIYEGTDKATGDHVAIKLETTSTNRLAHENQMYCKLQGGIGIPRVHWFGQEGEYTLLIIDLLGPSLEDLAYKCGHHFSLKTVLMLADQMLSRLEFIHTRGVLHRDIKPDNFLMGGTRNPSQVYIVDFGLAKQYYDEETGTHIPLREGRRLTGTALFTSVNVHAGLEPARRDDLEALGYVWLYFLRGSLPWQDADAKHSREKFKLIHHHKADISLTTLCQGVPGEFVAYLEYVRSLEFEQKPDYRYLKGLFRGLLIQSDFEMDFAFDWLLHRETRRPRRRVLK